MTPQDITTAPQAHGRAQAQGARGRQDVRAVRALALAQSTVGRRARRGARRLGFGARMRKWFAWARVLREIAAMRTQKQKLQPMAIALLVPSSD
jgi:hypothetical protein